ncbi:MAG: hypothetical protein WAT66_09100 [Actinomycetota bacterium]
MRRAVVLATAIFLVLPAAPAVAAGKNAKPVVKIASVEPVGAGDYRIGLEASDPDGVISELFLDFGDGVVLSLLLICGEPGEMVVQEITWWYAPGRYKLRAFGFSTSECFAGEVQQSRTDKAKIKVV